MTTGESSLPTGTVTFLRTDVEGSMGFARSLGATWDDLNATHLGLIRSAVNANDGVVVRTEGDAVFAAFAEAGAAVAAAVVAQVALAGHPWPVTAPIRVRMGLHSGEAHLAGDDYGGFDVNRAARIAASGHGGQILVSDTTATLVADLLPAGTSLRDLGRHVLRDVPRAERIRQLDVAGLQTDFPPLRTTSAGDGNLADRLTSFVGREADLDALTMIAAEARLVTLTGPGGIGKSSLGIELARRLAPGLRDGAWFVALADIGDPALVATTIARTLGLFDGADRSAADALPAYLNDRELLLVLDNYEHVLDAAPLVAGLLRDARHLQVIVTSRAPLRIGGEREVPVRPLGVDLGEDAARRLFLDRARAVRPGWDPGPEAPVVDEICVLLDGLPLGLELTAARVGTLPLTLIRDRLAKRLPLPGSGPRDAPDRQQTLDGAVAWSHDLLDAPTQSILHALAVFDGGFDLQQAVPVVGTTDGDVLDHIVRLADHSLIVVAENAAGMRYRMLRTIQSFALTKLSDALREPATRRRHADAFLALAREHAPRLTTFDQARSMDRLAADDANLHAAVRWSIDAGEADLAQGLVASLWRYWQITGQLGRTRDLADEAIRMPGGQAPSTTRMWAAAAHGNIAYWRGDSPTARDDYQEQERLARMLGDEAGLADAVFNLGHVAFIDGADDATLRGLIEAADARYRDLGDVRGSARARWAYGTLAMTAGRMDEAQASFERALLEFEANLDVQYQAMTEASLGWLALVREDLPTAARWSVRGISHTHAMRDVATTTISLHVGVLLGVVLGRFEDAVRLSGAFDGLCARNGVQPPAALGRFVKQMDPFERARAAVTPEDYQRLYADGRRMTLDEAVALFIDLGELAAGTPSG